MEKKPITTFLKVMSIIILIQSVLGVLINGLAVFLVPVVGMAGGVAITPIAWISLAVAIVCEIINFVLAVLALQHKDIELVYKAAIFTFIAPIVFNCVAVGGISDYLSILSGAVIPGLFLYAVFQQNKFDKAQ